MWGSNPSLFGEKLHILHFEFPRDRLDGCAGVGSIARVGLLSVLACEGFAQWRGFFPEEVVPCVAAGSVCVCACMEGGASRILFLRPFELRTVVEAGSPRSGASTVGPTQCNQASLVVHGAHTEHVPLVLLRWGLSLLSFLLPPPQQFRFSFFPSRVIHRRQGVIVLRESWETRKWDYRGDVLVLAPKDFGWSGFSISSRSTPALPSQ